MTAVSNAKVLWQFFFDMCLLKKNPQDLPDSTFLLQLLIVCNIAINFVINIATTSLPVALALSVLAVLLVYSFTRLLLWTLNFSSRSRKTLIAIFGTDLVIALPAIGLRYWLHWLETHNLQSDLAIILWILVFIWNLLVTAHILRHALDKPFGVGVIASIGYTVIVFNVMYSTHDWLVNLN